MSEVGYSCQTQNGSVYSLTRGICRSLSRYKKYKITVKRKRFLERYRAKNNLRAFAQIVQSDRLFFFELEIFIDVLRCGVGGGV